MFLWFQGLMSCRIKPKKFCLFSFLVRVPVIFHVISEGLCNGSFTEEMFSIKNWKNIPNIFLFYFFLQFYWPPSLGKKIFTTSNVLKPRVYLACINFWKFHDDLKACLEVIRLPSWPKNVKFSVKMQFFTFLTPWKICFWINDKL